MTTKYQSDKGSVSLTADAEHKFAIYFCVECDAPHAAFGIARADGRLNYCGWKAARPVCIGKGRAEDGGKVLASAPPW